MSEAIFSVLGMSVAAFAIWLTVRVVSRRERWAKWTAVAMTLLLVVYPLSWGPALFVYQSNDRPSWADVPMQAYAPLAFLLNSGRPRYLEPYRMYIFSCMVKGK